METINGKRHTLTLSFGYGHTDWHVDQFFRSLHEQLVKDFGGLRTNKGVGLWASDGNTNPPYTGEIYGEDVVTITVTVDVDPEFATHLIQEACRYAKHRTEGDVPMEWVNVEVTQTEAHHFKM
jgi:hypothetical protein